MRIKNLKFWLCYYKAKYMTNLRETNLREADLYKANLREADLYKADLREANLRGASLYKANLREADLREANLYKANLRGADLREANLYKANLRGADLREANLREVDLYKANLREARGIIHIQFYGFDIWIQLDCTKIGCEHRSNEEWLKMSNKTAFQLGAQSVEEINFYRQQIKTGIELLKSQ